LSVLLQNISVFDIVLYGDVDAKDRKGGWNISTNESFIIYRNSLSRNIIIRMSKRRKVRWVGM